MKDETFDAIRDAVNVARNEGVTSVRSLRARLEARGHASEHIDEALVTWANRVGYVRK